MLSCGHFRSDKKRKGAWVLRRVPGRSEGCLQHSKPGGSQPGCRGCRSLPRAPGWLRAQLLGEAVLAVLFVQQRDALGHLETRLLVFPVSGDLMFTLFCFRLHNAPAERPSAPLLPHRNRSQPDPGREAASHGGVVSARV